MARALVGRASIRLAAKKLAGDRLR